jgi:hypothetical protein
MVLNSGLRRLAVGLLLLHLAWYSRHLAGYSQLKRAKCHSGCPLHKLNAIGLEPCIWYWCNCNFLLHSSSVSQRHLHLLRCCLLLKKNALQNHQNITRYINIAWWTLMCYSLTEQWKQCRDQQHALSSVCYFVSASHFRSIIFYTSNSKVISIDG